MPWQLPFPFPIPTPPPLALLTAMYLFVSYMPYSRISQIKKLFNLANAIQRHF